MSFNLFFLIFLQIQFIHNFSFAELTVTDDDDDQVIDIPSGTFTPYLACWEKLFSS